MYKGRDMRGRRDGTVTVQEVLGGGEWRGGEWKGVEGKEHDEWM